jgi:hypothetical protein
MSVSRATNVKQTGTAGAYVGTTAAEARRALGARFVENSIGTPRSGILDPAYTNIVVGTGNMSYDVMPCQAIINRAANEGVYDVTFTGITNIATGAAPASGLSRYDLIWVRQNDPDKGDASNLPELGVTQGTAAASPSRPALPNGAMQLAEARVYSGTTGTLSSPNTITQSWKYTTMKGGTLNVRSAAERAELLSPHIGMRVRRLDKDQWVQEFDGTSWHYIGAKKRADGPITTFYTASAASRQIILMNFSKPYPIYVDVYGGATVYCPAISTGMEEINICVSANQNTAAAAQAKYRMTWNPSFDDCNQTGGNRCLSIPIPANTDIVARVWIEVVTGTLSLSVSGSVWSWINVDYWPQDD